MKQQPESGFALLLVFAMAATVAILLYKELPRLVFESQRIREQDLIDRGEQYRRAIQLYVRKYKKYPASLDDLDRGSDVRFLRRRYEDPMTGKQEWRLIHIDAAGFYTDSLIHKPPEKEKEKKSQNTFITEGAAFGSTAPTGRAEGEKGGPGLHGASDRPAASVAQYRGAGGPAGQPYPPGSPPPPGAAPAPGQQQVYPYPYQQYAGPPVPGSPAAPGQQPYTPGQPGQVRPGSVPGAPNPYGGQPAGSAGTRPGVPVGIGQYVVPVPSIPGSGQPGQTPGRPSLYGQPQPAGQQGQRKTPVGFGQFPVPGQTGVSPGQPAATSPYPRQGIPGLPGPYGRPLQQPPQAGYATGLVNPAYRQPGASSPSPAATRPGAGLPTPGSSPQGNPALLMIQQLITSPRPGGLPGTVASAGTGTQVIGGGIAGVASTLEAEGIKVYQEHNKYNEWEFLYDYRQEQSAMGAAAVRGAGAGGNRNPLGSSQGRSPFGGGSPFGSGSSVGSPGRGGPGAFGGAPVPTPPARGPIR